MIYTIDESSSSQPILISEDDIYINCDKFKTGESKILQITGLSGSGKSTLGKELAKKYNAYLIETDIICFAISRPDRANWEYIKEHDKYLYRYMKEKNISPEFMMKYHYTTITRTTADERDTEGLKYLRWLYFEADAKERIIVEGGCVAFSIMKDDKFLKIPTIFKGTSIIYSMLRRLHRSAVDDKKGYVKALQIAAEYFYKQYSKMVPEVNAARDKALNYKNSPDIPYISSEEDIYINMDKFESTKKILILGLSGSGKSTLADKLAKKYNAEHVNLDRIRGNKYYDDSTFNKENPSIAEWFRKEYQLGDRKGFNDLPSKVRKEEWNKCFYWLLNQNKPMIIEGHFDYLLMDDERLQTQYPIVIKRTSMTTSIFRMLKRELSREHNESTPLVKWLLKHLQTYPNAKKEIDNAIGVVMKHYPEDYEELSEATYPDKEDYDLKDMKFTHIDNPNYKGDEPYIYIEGKKLRVRSEIIMFDKQGRIFLAERMHPRQDMTYAFPGGGVEPNETIVEAAIRECQEEALMVPKNVKYTGYHYRVFFDVPKGKDMQYEGVLAYVCVGEYARKYLKYVKKQDRDSMAERGRWVYPDAIELSPVHKMAIESYKKSSIQESILPTLTFYHGSPEKLDKIEPVSFSAGNKFRKPEWAVFMFKQKELADDFAFSRALHMYLRKNNIDKFDGSIIGYMEKLGISTYKYHHFIKENLYNELRDIAIGLKYYVYALEVPIDTNLSVIGTTYTLPEYTYTGEPKVVKREEMVVTGKTFDSRYEPISEKQFEKYNKQKIYKQNVIGPWMSLFIDMEDRSKKRKYALKKMKEGELKPGDDLSFLDNLEESVQFLLKDYSIETNDEILTEMDMNFLNTEYE